MSDGKSFRLGRLFRGGRILCVPLDHGVTLGPKGGLQDIRATVSSVLNSGASAIVVHKGVVPHLVLPSTCGLIVHLSASTNLGSDPSRKAIVTSVTEALALGADAVSVHVNFGSPWESEMLTALGSVSRQCGKFGLPLVAMAYVRPEQSPEVIDTEPLGHAARVVAELGADLVKVSFPGNREHVEQVVSGCPIPVMIAGGPLRPARHTLSMARASIDGGAAGVSFGRNIFERRTDSGMVDALAAVVFDGATPESACEGSGT